MSDRKLGVAIHGVGQVAYAHAASWIKNPHTEIVSITSRRKESAKRLAEKFGLDCHVGDDYDEALRIDGVDIVNLSGPNHVHTDQGVAAAEKGKHLLMEKPMCLSMEENARLRDAVATAGVKSVVSFVLRWNPLIESLESLLASGAIGDLFYIEVDYWHGLSDWWTGFEWGRTLERGGSTMLTGGCHAVDCIRGLAADDEIVEVSAFANNIKKSFEYPANVVAALRFASGAIGKTSALFDAEMPYQFNIDLAGTEGTLRDNRVWSKKLFPGQTGWSTMQTILPDSGDVDHHPFDAEMDHLVDCILQDRQSHVNIADAYKTHEVCIAIDRSIAQGGQPVKLPLD